MASEPSATTTDEQPLSPLARAVRAASGRADVARAVGRVYADIQAAVDARRPVCDASGRCCRFEEYGHRLYVSTLELAAFVSEWSEAGRKSLANAQAQTGRAGTSLPLLTTDPRPPASSGGACPFQVDKLCGVHAIRPFGCRMFFCDPTSTQWQNDAYEGYHAELKRLHEALGVPYFYVEWRHALGELGLARDVVAPGGSSF